MPGGSLAQTFDMERGRRRKTALHDHSISVAGVIVARRTVDVVSLAAATQVGGSDGEREEIGGHAIDSAGVEELVRTQLTARHGTLDDRPFGTAIGKEGARVFRNVL